MQSGISNITLNEENTGKLEEVAGYKNTEKSPNCKIAFST